jgi:hypothetical protein
MCRHSTTRLSWITVTLRGSTCRTFNAACITGGSAANGPGGQPVAGPTNSSRRHSNSARAGRMRWIISAMAWPKWSQ